MKTGRIEVELGLGVRGGRSGVSEGLGIWGWGQEKGG